MKYTILSFVAFICRDIQVQIEQNGTHQSTMFHDMQALLDMLQRSHTFHILILFFNIRDKEIYNPFDLVPLFKRFTYKNKIQTFMY